MVSRQNGAKFQVDKTWLQSGKEKMWQVNKMECWQMESSEKTH
jgi:hypothetical protein